MALEVLEILILQKVNVLTVNIEVQTTKPLKLRKELQIYGRDDSSEHLKTKKKSLSMKKRTFQDER
jgi:hypothetical protein